MDRLLDLMSTPLSLLPLSDFTVGSSSLSYTDVGRGGPQLNGMSVVKKSPMYLGNFILDVLYLRTHIRLMCSKVIKEWPSFKNPYYI